MRVPDHETSIVIVCSLQIAAKCGGFVYESMIVIVG